MYPHLFVIFKKCCAILCQSQLRQASYGFIDWQDDWKLPDLKHWVGSVDLSLADREDCDDTQKEHTIKTQSQGYRVQQHRDSDGNACMVRRVLMMMMMMIVIVGMMVKLKAMILMLMLIPSWKCNVSGSGYIRLAVVDQWYPHIEIAYTDFIFAEKRALITDQLSYRWKEKVRSTHDKVNGNDVDVCDSDAR